VNKKQRVEIIKAMMVASGLSPEFKDDYWEGFEPENIARFFNGLVDYFGVNRNGWYFHFNSLDYMDYPSHAVEFISTHLPVWQEQER